MQEQIDAMISQHLATNGLDADAVQSLDETFEAPKFSQILSASAVQRYDNLLDSGGKKPLQHEYLDAKIGVNTAENEPSKVLAEKSKKSSGLRTFHLRYSAELAARAAPTAPLGPRGPS